MIPILKEPVKNIKEANIIMTGVVIQITIDEKR